LTCQDDQAFKQQNIHELCRVRVSQRCILHNYSIAAEDEILHPQGTSQKVCLAFQEASINVSKFKSIILIIF
jgi:hypothetical protein